RAQGAYRCRNESAFSCPRAVEWRPGQQRFVPAHAGRLAGGQDYSSKTRRTGHEILLFRFTIAVYVQSRSASTSTHLFVKSGYLKSVIGNQTFSSCSVPECVWAAGRSSFPVALNQLIWGREGVARRRTAINSAVIAMAISSGVIAPISSPIGAC